jgi:hypothetical protein
VGFAALFGFSLGLGFLTNLPSLSLLVVLLLATMAKGSVAVLLLAIAFAAGRLAPFLWVVVRTVGQKDHDLRLHAALRMLTRAVLSARALEVVLLATVAALALASL